mmetsp:Transcript_29635/g.77735  ORF Transcript_29635/g.77735 Transcript_29635/m.77735 type:complete len:240 (-) Transcript_29635:203-922(-)
MTINHTELAAAVEASSQRCRKKIAATITHEATFCVKALPRLRPNWAPANESSIPIAVLKSRGPFSTAPKIGGNRLLVSATATTAAAPARRLRRVSGDSTLRVQWPGEAESFRSPKVVATNLPSSNARAVRMSVVQRYVAQASAPETIHTSAAWMATNGKEVRADKKNSLNTRQSWRTTGDTAFTSTANRIPSSSAPRRLGSVAVISSPEIRVAPGSSSVVIPSAAAGIRTIQASHVQKP